jgi:hypothetical protein
MTGYAWQGRLVDGWLAASLVGWRAALAPASAHPPAVSAPFLVPRLLTYYLLLNKPFNSQFLFFYFLEGACPSL